MTESKVIKRNGEVVEFDRKKIESAILKAMKHGSGILKEDIAEKISKEIEAESKSKKTLTIHQIETIVYSKLINYNQELTAKAYEGYRAVQSFKRKINTTDDIEDIIQSIIQANKNLSESTVSNNWEMVGSDVKELQTLINSLEKLLKEQEKEEESKQKNDVTQENQDMQENNQNINENTPINE